MKKYSFFLDFDDTLIETKHLVAQYLNKKYGVDLTTEDLVDNNGFNNTLCANGVGVSYNEVYLDFGKNFFPSFSLKDFLLYPNAKETIINLSSIYNLYITTSRQKVEKTYIEEILKYHEIYSCFQDIHCVWNYNGNYFVSETKSSFVEKKKDQETGIGFIDDSLAEVKEIVKTRCVASPSLFDPKKKYQKEGMGFEIFYNWKQIEKIFS